jgi:hypothetical protein
MGTKTLRIAYQTLPPGGDATVEMPHRMFLEEPATRRRLWATGNA